MMLATKHYTNDSVFNIFQDVPIEDAKVYIAMAPDDRDNLPFLQGYSNVIYSSRPDIVAEFAKSMVFEDLWRHGNCRKLALYHQWQQGSI